MAPALPALLCLGLSVGLRTQVQAGTLPKSTIWAEPGSVVLWGSPVTIWCWGTLWAQGFRLGKEGSPVLWDRQKPLEPWDKARFSIQHMRDDHTGSYRCYYSTPTGWSERSDPLELVVTGRRRRGLLDTRWTAKPRRADPGPVPRGPCDPRARVDVQMLRLLQGHPPGVVGPQRSPGAGQNLTLQCHSDIGYTRFALSKEGGQDLPQHDFPLGPVGTFHRGRYRCYGGHPSLLVQPGPSVAPGENVTLLCQSGERTDTFLLSKEGAAHRPLRLRSQDQAGRYQAEFSLSPVTSAHGGTYRCYGSLSTDPYLLSQPSEPLALVVSGEPHPRLHGAESHPDGPHGLGPAAPRGPALPGSARPRRSPRCGPELSTEASHCPKLSIPGRQLPAWELLEEPLWCVLGALSAETLGERCEMLRGGGRRPLGAQPLLTGVPLPPGEDAPTPGSYHPRA
uniref:LILR1 n=1 Tax=Bos taurus TaxID=9913 RepID=A0A075CA42_BOVIN|nr:LILR1 [Bos taurus]